MSLQRGEMATRIDTSVSAHRVNVRGSFYTWVAFGTFLIFFAGFARTYYLKILFGTPALPLLLHLHGFLFTSWFVLFFVQARLVAKDRVDLHRRLGIFGAVLAPLRLAWLLRLRFMRGGEVIWRTQLRW